MITQTQLQPLTQYQKRKLQQAKDEKYLEKRIIMLTNNKSEIQQNIKIFRRKFNNNGRNFFVSPKRLANLMCTNKRTIHLLASHKYISSFSLCSNYLIDLGDVRDFIKTLTTLK